MISILYSRAARFIRGIISFFFLCLIFSLPQRLLARTPQSPDAPPAPQQPTPEPVKKDSVVAAPNSAATPKPTPAKPHRVFTNDDISTRSSVPVAPGARRRLKQLNRCNLACFHEVEKQSITNYGYLSVHPRSTRQEMEDHLAAYIEELHNDPNWQQLLLEWISADLNRCEQSQRHAANPQDAPPHTPTRQEILDEEERARNYRPPPGTDANAASSAVLSYRFKGNQDPLRVSFMLHQYFDELHQTCQVQYQAADSEDDEDP